MDTSRPNRRILSPHLILKHLQCPDLTRPLTSESTKSTKVAEVRIASRDLILLTERNLTERNLDGHRDRYPPQPAHDQISQRLSHYSDTSIPLYTLFLRLSDEHDRRKDGLSKGEIDSILVFVSHCVGYHYATSPFTRKL